MAKTVGYMRISTKNKKQKFDRQLENLSEYVEHVYYDRMSGGQRNRPYLNEMLEDVEEGDTVYIVSLDRLGRSTADNLEIISKLIDKGVHLKSLHDSWLDLSSDNPMQGFLITVMSALAQFEKDIDTVRIREGVEVAKEKGVRFGRPEVNASKVRHALELYYGGQHTAKEICSITDISRRTLYNKKKQYENGELDIELKVGEVV